MEELNFQWSPGYFGINFLVSSSGTNTTPPPPPTGGTPAAGQIPAEQTYFKIAA